MRENTQANAETVLKGIVESDKMQNILQALKQEGQKQVKVQTIKTTPKVH